MFNDEVPGCCEEFGRVCEKEARIRYNIVELQTGLTNSERDQKIDLKLKSQVWFRKGIRLIAPFLP